LVASGIFLFLFLFIDVGFVPSAIGGILSLFAGFLVFRAEQGVVLVGLSGPAREEYDKALKEAERNLGRLEAASGVVGGVARFDAANAAAGKAAIDKAASAVRAVIDDVKRDPKDFRHARRFLAAYLESAVRIAETYAEIMSRGVHEGEAARAAKKSEAALETFAAAFDKLRTRLLEDDAMELGAEIETLERTLEAEGLSESERK
jgi:uncharacterized membrane protein YccC